MEPATHRQPSNWKPSMRAWKQEEVRMREQQIYGESKCPGWTSEGRRHRPGRRVRRIVPGEEDAGAVLENGCRVCLCLQAFCRSHNPIFGSVCWWIRATSPAPLRPRNWTVRMSVSQMVHYSPRRRSLAHGELTKCIYEAFTSATDTQRSHPAE